MEDWELDFSWLKTRHFVKNSLERSDLPDLNAILFLIGIQELGIVQDAFSKEEKQDLMHIAVCTLFLEDGYFEFAGRDADGWPHYNQTRRLTTQGKDAQERLIKMKVIEYFDIVNKQ